MSFTLTRITNQNREAFLPLFYENKEPAIRIGAADDNKVCGIMGLDPEAGSLRISSLYVLPQYRKKGVASLLFEQAVSLMKGTGTDIITAEFEGTPELRNFFARQGFNLFETVSALRINTRGLMQSKQFALAKRLAVKARGCKEIRELSANDFDIAFKFVAKYGFDLQSAKYDEEMSWAVIEKGVPRACLLCTTDVSSVRIELLIGDKTDPSMIAAPISRLVEKMNALPKYAAADIRFVAENNQVDEFAKSIFSVRGIGTDNKMIKAVKIISKEK